VPDYHESECRNVGDEHWSGWPWPCTCGEHCESSFTFGGGDDRCILPFGHDGDAHEGERWLWGDLKLEGQALKRYREQYANGGSRA
jgi:hypothetical protein